MITDLEEAIKIHLANERKLLHPGNNSIVNLTTEMHIKSIERAPRDSASLKAIIARKKKVLEHPNSIEEREHVYTELQACERLLGMVRLSEEGRPLDGVAY